MYFCSEHSFFTDNISLTLLKSSCENSFISEFKTKNPQLKSCEKKSTILEFLKNTDDSEIISKKRILTRNVPYRLQAPFMVNIKGKT